MRNEKGQFVKGQPAWNKGIKRYWSSSTEFKKGQSASPGTQFKKGEVNQRGAENSSWKGGKPKCSVCAKQLTGYKQTKCKSCTSGVNHPLWKGGKPNCRQAGCETVLSDYTSIFCKYHSNFQERNPNWKGGVDSVSTRLRKTSAYATWRTHVFTRDSYTCQSCGTRGGKLHADHELPFSKFPDLRLEILNGRTLCIPCHKLTPTYLNAKVISQMYA